MKYLLTSLCAIAVSSATVASPAHAQESLSPQLMLRPSYFYVEVDPVSAEPLRGQPPEPLVLRDDDGVVVGYASPEAREASGMSRGGKIALGVCIPILVAGVAFAIAVPVAVRNSFEDW